MSFYFPHRTFVATLLATALPMVSLAANEETLVEIKAIAGMRFDPPRFLVAPGQKVKLVMENTDDMAHNLIITKPDARVDVVNMTLTMPVTPTSDFLPATDKVLWHLPVLAPGKSASVSFTAPEKEGVYPYVCTFPGHGFVMYGAMYVGKKAMPPLAKDANVPELWRSMGIGAPMHAFEPKPPYLYRIFMRDSGPASIAVALPGGQNYCWDAGACRLRYVWRGGFVEPSPHWNTNGDAFAEVLGRIYYRANAGFPIRFGSADKLPPVKFRGYRLVERFPEFRYEVDGVEVLELIKPQHHGGLETTFTIANAPGPVLYVTDKDSGAKIESPVGAIQDGVLKLTPEQAKKFTVTLTEIPGKEPLAYYSMNDTLASPPNFAKQKNDLETGVKGRAIKFDGKKTRFDTAVKTTDLKNGGTIELWVQCAKPKTKDMTLIGATVGADVFALALNFGGTGLGVTSEVAGKSTRISTNEALPADEWHHVAATISPSGIAFYLDGKKCGEAAGATLPADAVVTIGSLGADKLFAGMLDELRIFDRVLNDAEIRAIYTSERPNTANK